MGFDPRAIAREHLRILAYYEEKLTEEEKLRARRDPHSFREPRFCGLTVHLARGGCPYRCTYCYIYDMGFGENAEPYPLSPEELAYAILTNRNFLATRYGTLLAVGSVTEPFLFADRAIMFLTEISKLGNPIQFSTKAYISKALASKLSRVNAPLSPLVTIITLELSDMLEPYAPKPQLRLETLRNLREVGLRPCLFLRPIIPGVTDHEAVAIMRTAKEWGAECVVVGTLRVTRNIIIRLRRLGVETRNIEKRVSMKELEKYPDRQIPVPLKPAERRELLISAKRLGLVVFRTACCANSYNAGVPCPSVCFETKFCTKCPNECWLRPRPSIDHVREALRILGVTTRITFDGRRILVDDKKYISLIRTLSRRVTLPHRPYREPS